MKKIVECIEIHTEFILKRGILIIIALFLLAAAALGYGYGDKGERTSLYDESSSSISYKVYLKPNNTYEGSYIIGSADRSYPTSLIDYLDLDYNYVVNFNEEVEGDLTYKLVELTSADKVDGATTANLWSEEHAIVEPQDIHVKGNSFNIAQNTKITYDTYTTILRNFEAEARGVTAKGTLNVALVITGELKPASFTEPAAFNTRLDFTIPIETNSSVEAVANTKGNQTSVLRETPTHLDFWHSFIAFLGFVLLICGVLAVIAYIIAHRHKLIMYPYEENIRKLLSAYDGIIVEITHAPVFKNTSVSDVEEFDELLDVYNSVHLPINYYKSRKASYFVIIGDKNAWRYIVSESDFKRNGKKH